MATVDIVHGERIAKGVDADTRNGLWLEPDAMERVAGWTLKAEGFCRGEACFPVPPSRKDEFVAGGRYNLGAVAELAGQPVIRDDEHRTWCIGEAAAERKRALTSLDAPDFALPDLEGKVHRLSDYRGKKVLLASWASW